MAGKVFHGRVFHFIIMMFSFRICYLTFAGFHLQLPEPLMTFDLYPEFIQIAKVLDPKLLSLFYMHYRQGWYC